jgi:hypothetical protein
MLQRPFERSTVAGDVQVSPPHSCRIAISPLGQQLSRELEGIPNAQSDADVELAREREVHERRMRQPASHAAPIRDDVRHGML